MRWNRYTLAFRLLSPLHVGYRQVGNLMQTRPYVPGKLVWAALTARLTRDYGYGSQSDKYDQIGDSLKESFRCGYLYPALELASEAEMAEGELSVGKDGLRLRPAYAWEDRLFDYRFLSSYASTALDYDYRAAAEASLHETEFICPLTRPVGDHEEPTQVYLVGSLYVKAAENGNGDTELPSEVRGWKESLGKIQLGGERSYGWGKVELVSELTPVRYEGATSPNGDPIVSFATDSKVTAHVNGEGIEDEGLLGPIEPLVGWERDNDRADRAWRLSKAVICYSPGSRVRDKDRDFRIGSYGILHAME